MGVRSKAWDLLVMGWEYEMMPSKMVLGCLRCVYVIVAGSWFVDEDHTQVYFVFFGLCFTLLCGLNLGVLCRMGERASLVWSHPPAD